MVMIAETDEKSVKLSDLQKRLKEMGEEMGLDIKAQHQDIFNSMHRI